MRVTNVGSMPHTARRRRMLLFPWLLFSSDRTPRVFLLVWYHAPNTSLVPVYDRITFFGSSALSSS